MFSTLENVRVRTTLFHPITTQKPQIYHQKNTTFFRPPSKNPTKPAKIPSSRPHKKNHKTKFAADRKIMPQERILIVDDEESVRVVAAALLEQSGYVTTTIESAEEAIARLQQDPDYDLVLSDIMMPGTDGLTLLDHICTDH